MARKIRGLCSSFYTILIILSLLTRYTKAVPYQVKFSLMEERKIGTFIGNTSSAQGFLDAVPSEDRNNLVFSFLTQTNLKSMLNILGPAGSLYTTVVVDREQIDGCDTPEECKLEFDVAARSNRSGSLYFEIISVVIVIEDKNDNAPEFPHPVQNINISESSTNGTAIIIDSAVDDDMGANNSIQHYELIGHTDKFALDVSKKLDRRFTVRLVVIGRLDRELVSSYLLRVVARDGGTPARSGSTDINVKILDVNDNAPILNQTVYNITVKEELAINDGILQIKATDKDVGRNGDISYRFSPFQPDLAEIQKYFMIEEGTGVLKVIQQLVYVPGKTHHIIVEAVDRGDPPMVSQNQAVINVNVLDTGNTQPVVQINLLQSGRIKNVSENAGFDLFVAHVYVDDPDTGDNGKVTCTVPSEFFGIRNMSRKGYYKIVVEGKLDREKQETHTVLVHCRDHGSPALSNSSTFIVRVMDENDNSPIFTRKTYVEYLYENNKKYDVVISVEARDKDIGDNGEIYYYLEDRVASKLTINSSSGVIKANDYVFNREVEQSLNFTVYASDRGRPPRIGNASVIIYIEDRNDNAPIFDTSIFKFNVSENFPSGSLVDTLRADDPDLGDNSIFTYSFTNSTEPGLPFVVFPNGEIKTNQMLDREERSIYEFMVMAADKGVPSMTSLAMVVVKVLDMNDKEPDIEFPREGDNIVSVLHGSPVGTKITEIRAKDRDIGINKKLSYVIESGNEKRLFVMDLDTGELFMSREYHVEKNESYTLVISVHDGGVPQHSVRCELTVIVQFSNTTTTTEPVSDPGINHNVAIAIVVVLVTLFLSTAIIVVICVIRKFDRNRRKNPCDIGKLQNNMSDMKDDTFQNGTIMSRPYDKMEMPRKKKEVSFSLEEDLDRLNDHELSFGNNSVFTDIHNESCSSDRQQSQFKTFQLHQTLLDSAPPPPSWSEHQKAQEAKNGCHPEDSHSETSRETVNSDSGKGGSEEDIPISHSFKEDMKDSSFGGPNPSSHIMRCSAPKDRRGVSPERTHSAVLEDRFVHNASYEKSKRQSLPISMQDKPKFSVRKPYIEKEIRDTKAQTESWVPSYV